MTDKLLKEIKTFNKFSEERRIEDFLEEKLNELEVIVNCIELQMLHKNQHGIELSIYDSHGIGLDTIKNVLNDVEEIFNIGFASRKIEF